MRRGQKIVSNGQRYLHILARADGELRNGAGNVVAQAGDYIAYHVQYPTYAELRAHLAYCDCTIGRVLAIGTARDYPSLKAANKAGRWVLGYYTPPEWEHAWTVTVRGYRHIMTKHPELLVCAF